MTPADDPGRLLDVLHEAATAVRTALDGLADWGPAGTKPGQYRSDLAADEAALAVLHAGGLGTMSEESGAAHADRALVAVLDPVDGSTNASRGIPWFATSICVLDGDGPLVSLVVNQALGVRHWAVRGGGAFVDGRPLRPAATQRLGDAIVLLSGIPAQGPLPWRQYRALGACALDLCAVAGGTADAFLDTTSPAAHGSWDYLGGMHIAREAGAVVVDALGADLVTRAHADRRTPVAACSQALLDELLDASRVD